MHWTYNTLRLINHYLHLSLPGNEGGSYRKNFCMTNRIKQSCTSTAQVTHQLTAPTQICVSVSGQHLWLGESWKKLSSGCSLCNAAEQRVLTACFSFLSFPSSLSLCLLSQPCSSHRPTLYPSPGADTPDRSALGTGWLHTALGSLCPLMEELRDPWRWGRWELSQKANGQQHCFPVGLLFSLCRSSLTALGFCFFHTHCLKQTLALWKKAFLQSTHA